ncbi:MAG: hypothetical protein EP343_08695 [Deltaproteobacteria bacterium]|nr:MAG: hypothetical protein EP343_08695 [Deltaproteobacteria bacterium]
MAARRRHKRNVREEIRERQAYASMELALLDYQDHEQSSAEGSGNQVVHSEELKNSPLEAALKEMAPIIEEREKAAEEKAMQSAKAQTASKPEFKESAEPALAEPTSSNEEAEATSTPTSNWDGKSDSMDLTMFLMFFVALFAMVGALGM